MKVNFKDNIFWGLSISLVLLILSSIASYISIRNLIKSSDLVEHSNDVLDNLHEVLSIIKDAETSQRGYIVTGNGIFLKKYEEALPTINPLIDILQQETIDNPVQQQNVETLRTLANKRMETMAQLLAERDKTGSVLESSMLKGKEYMDGIRSVMRQMRNEERGLLKSRTESLNVWSKYTPVVIIITALLAMGVTLVFYRRVTSDFNEKKTLQAELELRNSQIQSRIEEIENLAAQVSKGNYDIRFREENKDKIGTLATSLNAMAESLGKSFKLLHSKEWLQTGIAAVSDSLVGQKNEERLTNDSLAIIASYTGSLAGAIYVRATDGSLNLMAGYSLDLSSVKKTFLPGEGVPGEAARSATPIILKDYPEESLNVSFVAGAMKPKYLLAIRIRYDEETMGIMELASNNHFTDLDLELLKATSENLGAAMAAAQSRKRLQELLEETQSQSEELQSQTTELENINAELEAQSLRLQASEEELRVQQEELLQSNQELEERTALLEERNQIIRERNLEIEQKSRELEQSSRYKSEFLANMSHELRTPLNSILLLSKLMSDSTALDKEFVEYADVIQSSGQGLLKLIDEILDLSKIESGKMQLEIMDVAVSEISSDLNRLFTEMARSKNLEFSINSDKTVPAQIRTDKLRLEQILKNLLSNAIKFTAKGSVSMSISADESREHIIFKVRDTGIGVAPDKLNMVFEAFQQADGSTRRKYGGTGLGLSISRELAKLLGGQISLQSEENKGSEFTLTLPVHYQGPREIFPEEQGVDEDAAEPVSEKIPAAPVERPLSFAHFDDDRDNIAHGDKVILIIEDDESFAKILLNYTHQRNYKGIVSLSGEEGLEMAKAFRPSAILLDILLPGINGWQVLDELKADDHTKNIPVHIMSSLQVRNKSILSGAVDFIDKPISLEKMQTVFQKLEQALQRHDKVLILEESKPHAQALAYFLSVNEIHAQVTGGIDDSVAALKRPDVDCVILDKGVPAKNSLEILENIKQRASDQNLAIIVFTGKNLSKGEELLLKKYADSIVVKTAHSYQRILDEAGLFLHLVEEGAGTREKYTRPAKMTELGNILNGKTVLIVDDDVRNIFSLSKALELHKIKVLTAIDGKEAVALLKEKKLVDAVLMDMMMPEMDGYETIKQVRVMPGFKNIPILAVTAKAMAGDREKCIAAGASDYISKPVDVDQLISLLRVWLYKDK